MEKNVEATMRKLVRSMLLIKPEMYLTLEHAQGLINIYRSKGNIDISYGLVQSDDKGNRTYVDTSTLPTLDVNEQAKADINILLLEFADTNIDQILFTLHKVDNDFQIKFSFYNDIFTKERNDPEAELLFWRNQLGYEPQSDDEKQRIAKVATYFEDKS